MDLELLRFYVCLSPKQSQTMIDEYDQAYYIAALISVTLEINRHHNLMRLRLPIENGPLA